MPPVTRAKGAMSKVFNNNQDNDQFEIKSKKKSHSDYSAIILLVVLYLLQGVPLGLAMGSLPYILKSKLSFSELAMLSLSQYPYSLKVPTDHDVANQPVILVTNCRFNILEKVWAEKELDCSFAVFAWSFDDLHWISSR
jgi:hypothetical protein